MNQLKRRVHSLLNEAADDLSLEAGKTVKVEEEPKYGFFFRVTRKDEKVGLSVSLSLLYDYAIFMKILSLL